VAHSHPLDLSYALELLADAPYGMRETLIDAALEGPVSLVEADEQRRAAWITLLTAVLPDARVSATGPEEADEGAIDTRAPTAAEPSRFASVAAAVAGRNPAALTGERDAVALAVHGGATDLLTPEDLPRALELITDLARRGEVATAARAAAGLGAPATALVLAEVTPAGLEVLTPPEPGPVDAVVVEEREAPEPEPVDAVVVEEREAPEPEEEIVAWAPPVVEDVIEDVVVVDEQPEPMMWLPPVVEAVVPPPEADPPEAVREDSFGGGLPLHDLEEAVEPAPDSGRSLEELMAAFATDPLEAPPAEAPDAEDEPADQVIEEVEVGMSLAELEATLQVTEEAEVGMSLEEFEASLKRERET
jgi:hypothetical protein